MENGIKKLNVTPAFKTIVLILKHYSRFQKKIGSRIIKRFFQHRRGKTSETKNSLHETLYHGTRGSICS